MAQSTNPFGDDYVPPKGPLTPIKESKSVKSDTLKRYFPAIIGGIAVIGLAIIGNSLPKKTQTTVHKSKPTVSEQDIEKIVIQELKDYCANNNPPYGSKDYYHCQEIPNL